MDGQSVRITASSRALLETKREKMKKHKTPMSSMQKVCSRVNCSLGCLGAKLGKVAHQIALVAPRFQPAQRTVGQEDEALAPAIVNHACK